MTTYADAGVDRALGDDASKILYKASRMTWANRTGRFGEVVEFFSTFSGLRGIRLRDLPEDTIANLGFDGIGTKVLIAQRMEKHDTVGYDLLAMVVDDAVVRGAEPVLVGSVLDVKSLREGDASHIDLIRQLAQGYIGAAQQARVAIVNGETAELGACVSGYGAFNYNWGAAAAWFGRESRLLKGNEIRSGDHIIALREQGFRSNGLSLVRKILGRHHGEQWHIVTPDYDARESERPYETQAVHPPQRLGDLVLHPSRIYCAAVVDMMGSFPYGEPRVDVHGVVHVTGGGIPEKLGRVLRPSGLGAHLTTLFEPPRIMRYVQSLGNVSDEEAYKTWNMGQGMLVITPEVDEVIAVAREHGIKAQHAGEITDSAGILIRSKGNTAYDAVLPFTA